MSKIKVKKHETFIDMTAMSDVTVLLLTFFMLTSTFITPEPVQVTTPSSVSEIKIPENNLLTILLNTDGKVFMSLSNQHDMINTLLAVGEDYGISFTQKQVDAFKTLPTFGVPIRFMPEFLNLPDDKQSEFLRELTNVRVGIPSGDEETRDGNVVISTDNEFKRWIAHAKRINPDIKFAIKSDKSTPYNVVKGVIGNMTSMREYRFLLITSLKGDSSE